MIIKNKKQTRKFIFLGIGAFIILFLLGEFPLFRLSANAAGLPGRVTSVALTCSVNGALSRTSHKWWDYPSNTTGQASDQIYKYENGGWVFKGSDYKSGTGSSGDILPAKGSYEGAGANFQARGRSWINNTGVVDLTQPRWCS